MCVFKLKILFRRYTPDLLSGEDRVGEGEWGERNEERRGSMKDVERKNGGRREARVRKRKEAKKDRKEREGKVRWE